MPLLAQKRDAARAELHRLTQPKPLYIGVSELMVAIKTARETGVDQETIDTAEAKRQTAEAEQQMAKQRAQVVMAPSDSAPPTELPPCLTSDRTPPPRPTSPSPGARRDV